MEISKIISGCKRKNRKAEKALFQTFSATILNLCLRYSKDESQAKDYLQECFIHLYQNIGKYESDKGAFRSWLYRLCINKILELKRKNKNLTIELSTNHFPDICIEDSELEYVTENELLSAIRKLPDGYRNVLNLFVFENLTHAQIGSLLQITESASRSQYSRSKSLLKKILIQSIPNIHEKRLA